MKHLFLLIAVAACGGSEEAPSVTLPVVVSSGGLAEATNDLGYTVTVARLRTAVRDLELTIRGETHDGPHPPMMHWRARHPGHGAGGDITGELLGDFLIDWSLDNAELGVATALVGDYHGANFWFRRATAQDELSDDDLLLGHTFHLEATARKDDLELDFTAVIDIDENTQLVGMPFAYEVTESSEATLRLEMLTVDPVEGDTIFDGLDFEALAQEGATASIAPGQDAHNILKRNLQVHDHYQLVAR